LKPIQTELGNRISSGAENSFLLYNLKLTCTFLFLNSSSTFPFLSKELMKGIVEEELRKRRVEEQHAYKLVLICTVLQRLQFQPIKKSTFEITTLTPIVAQFLDALGEDLYEPHFNHVRSLINHET
ncbi:hypothetical protein BpHYR1_035274, partial [Brachionus plicatilis]